MNNQSMLIIGVLSMFAIVFVFYEFRLPIDSSTTGSYSLENAFPNLTFTNPVGIYSPGNSSNRLFVVEQAGNIFSFENTPGVDTKELFLDITEKVLYGGEQGLLGLAFYPNYFENGYFYINYMTSNPRRTVISRFTVDLKTPLFADIASEEIIIEIGQPYANHNGGQIAFNLADGFLYIGLGDGGSGGDPLNHGQNRSTLLGSMLRIDVNHQKNGLAYAIPADNPFNGNTQGYREEIYAWGFRNPWRFSFDQNGTVWVGDVGQNTKEEISLITKKGQNFGWNIMEGFSCYSPAGGCNQTGLTLPIWDYGRSEGTTIIGGFVYDGNSLSELVGKYVYGDYGSGKIWALEYDGIKAVNTLLIDSNLDILSFGVDNAKDIYVCSSDGRIYKLAAPKNSSVTTLTTTTSMPNITSFLSFMIVPVLLILAIRKQKRKKMA
ncbi:MAG: PQQ-dependent sugar dehydrogenase [Candidatus Thorarchaeota archaeon]